ncbi:MAG: adenylate kinase [Dehalococcoidia bacterium]|nr:adenylate kinase [Dehalococcoidia bacterium]
MRVILLGPPGAGKGTQAATISKALGLAHIASGDLFREEQEKKSELGMLAKRYMERGELVPNEITIKMILGRISQKDAAKGFLLDGFPRNIEQAQALDSALMNGNQPGIDKVVLISVPNEELIVRLGGRWICRARQHPYHIVNSPPKRAGICDIDGSELYQRADDSEETARKRLKVYADQTEPLIGFYKKQRKLSEVDGARDIDVVGKELVSVLQ